ncbi:Spermidine N(1)-acetyltransferase [Corynebacterium atrinae]|uniref:GNAT family N-acetyltransferase n=1 Tax=Corynebacterium atrinae TaxID=1336740 RepID=UPI0025B44C7D|nr:GNAT family N-acetyltransferase [Corynebacterium atrinae]WJY62161.1 Spermidine N(1)-acetyltransferase [Corynebacterium atrinae]
MLDLSPLPLVTERLQLRLHRPDDDVWLHDIYPQAEVARFLLKEPWTREEAGQHLDTRLAKTDLDGPTTALALVIEHEGSPIGDISLWMTNAERRVAEIGWVLDPRFGGKGFAREAVRAVADMGFDHYRLHRIAAQMDARNTASAKLAATVGMQQEAHLRQDWWNKGEWTDTLIFGALSSDPRSPLAPLA